MTAYPAEITCPRWPYVLLTIAAGLLTVVLAMALVIGSRWDWTFQTITGSLQAAAIVWFISLAAKAIQPPTLHINLSGLTLLKGNRKRTWSWKQINSFYSVRTQRGLFVAFKWRKSSKSRPKDVWLNYPFSIAPEILIDILDRSFAVTPGAAAKPLVLLKGV